MQGKVEIVVLGTSDIGGRSSGARRITAQARTVRAEALQPRVNMAMSVEVELSAASVAPIVPDQSKPLPVVMKATPEGPVAPIAQDEFAFSEIESRGHFDKTDRNLFEGQDLDVPTYLRKGIRFAL
jgi:cell division protein FtsZ